MAVALATLVDRLKGAVPVRADVPTEEQYQQAVQDAALDLANRCPLRKLTTVAVVSGTATYALPADFRRIIKLDDVVSREDGVIVSESGLIPVSSSFRERVSVAGGAITFYPTPQYTAGRYLWYAAGYVLDAAEVYQEMTEDEGRLALLKAQAISLRFQANAVLGGAIRVKIGDEEFDKTKAGTNFQEQAAALEREYLAAAAARRGPTGMKARYEG